MSQWIYVPSENVEAKLTNKGELLLREQGQTTEYPHFTVNLDSRGNIVDYHASDSRYGQRFGSTEVIYAVISVLRGKGLL
jgi:hypothetical protein